MSILKFSFFGACLASFLFLSHGISAREYPVNNEVYTALRLPFHIDKDKNAASYTFRIGLGNCTRSEEITKLLANEVTSSTEYVIAEVPYFGSEYSWEVIYKNNKGKVTGRSPVYHFSTQAPPFGDTTKYRIRVITNSYADTALHFFLDNAYGLFDLNGTAKWFLPLGVSDVGKKGTVTNIMLTPSHTISMLASGRVYEADYGGDTLWTASAFNNKRPVSFHHEFVKRPNGNYMTLKWSNTSVKIPERYLPGMAPDPTIEKRNDGYYKAVDFGVLDEYNGKGEVIWSWDSKDYFSEDDLFSKRAAGGRYLSVTHLNAFYVDEEQQAVYAGFKEKSLIVKIRYADKKILAAFKGVTDSSLNFFRQHSITKVNDSTLLVFSNNIGKPMTTADSLLDADEKRIKDVSSVVMLKEGKGNSLSKQWEFFCDVDNEVLPASYRGGYATELPDGNLFICMGVSPRILILTKDKKILYNAVVEEWSESERKWIPFLQYRASPVGKKDLDELILKSIPRN
jgi:hypothetical protein